MADVIVVIIVILIPVAIIAGFFWHTQKKLEHERELAASVQDAETKEEILRLADQIEPICSRTARYIRSNKYLKERGFD